MSRKLLTAVFVLVGMLVFGTVGYMVVERWGLFDSLYMTVITISTVGFTEIHPLSGAGRVFTIVLLIAGIGALGYSLGTFIDFLVEGHLKGMLEGRHMARQIEGLSDHHIIAGFGRVGLVAASEFAHEGAPFVVIDTSDARIEEVRQRDWAYVKGDATAEETLVAAGIERAKSLIAALDQDADNLFVTVTAKTLNPSIYIVARTIHQSSEQKLLNGGADRVITPTVIGGRRMAGLVLHPSVSDYLDLVTHEADLEYRLQELDLPAGSPIAGKSIRESAVRDRFGAFILAVRGADGVFDTNPSFDRVLAPGDRLVLLGTEKQLAALVQAT